jgi:S1-C subfamily serine protease
VIIGPDIYGTSNVAREVFALRAQVQPGDSGGPLVAPDGTVVGIVFAASLDDPDTAYAFTAREALPVITLGAASTTAVSTGKCA